VLLAELEIFHTRPAVPTRRVALGHMVLPVEPAPGFGGVLLGAIVAQHIVGVVDDLKPDVRRLIDEVERGERIVQPRLRHRFQVDRHGLSHSRHRLVGESDDIEFEFGSTGSDLAQVLGAIAGAFVLYMIASGKAGFDVAGGLASNGYGAHSPGAYSLQAGVLTEIVMTLMFLLIILGATDRRAPAGFAPIAIGLGLTLIHLISIPVTNTSVNPARSTGPALMVGGWAIAQLWLFWVAPIAGALIAGFVYRWLADER